jgi:hypothetical protein
MIATIEPCKAGFENCAPMRAADVAKHPRTPRLAECPHYPIPPENPDRLQGPEVGTLCLYSSRYQTEPMVVRLLERSYVWGPGDPSYHGGARRYDWKVIARGPNGTRSLCVDDKDLVPLTDAEAFSAGGGPLTEGMVLA